MPKLQLYVSVLSQDVHRLVKMFSAVKSNMTRLLVTDMADGVAHAYSVYDSEKTVPSLSGPWLLDARPSTYSEYVTVLNGEGEATVDLERRITRPLKRARNQPVTPHSTTGLVSCGRSYFVSKVYASASVHFPGCSRPCGEGRRGRH